MAFQPVINEINTKYTKRLDNSRITTKITINCTDKSIGQVLSVGAKPSVISVLPASGSVMLEARALAKAVIIDKDDSYQSIEETITFSQPIIDSSVTPDSTLFANLSVVDTKNIQATEHYVSFDVTIDVSIFRIVEQNIATIQSLDQPAYQRTTNIAYSNLTYSGTELFELTNEVELPTNIGAVVQAQSDTILLETEAGEGIVTLTGKIIANLIYLTNEDTPRLKSQKYNINFTQEVPCDNASTLDNATAILQDCGTTYEVQGELSSAKGLLILKNSYSVITFVTTMESVDVVYDAFCPKYQLLPTSRTFTIQKNCYTQTFNEKIDDNIILANDSARIDRVLATISNVIDYKLVSNNTTSVQGVLYTNVIYELDDEKSTIGSVLAEIPFNIPLNISELNDADDVNVKLIITDIEARNKRSLEIDIIADVTICVSVTSCDTGVAISNIELGEPIPQDHPPMGIYYIENAETEWDIAKTLLVSPKLILSQNPELNFPITKPTQIILYRGRNLDTDNS